jgi:hypothetical protein
VKPSDVNVINVAIGPDGSVSVYGWLDNEDNKSVWTRTALAEAWTKKKADKFLNYHLKRAGARALPRSKTDKKRRKAWQNDDDSDSEWFQEVKAKVKRREQQSSEDAATSN